MSNQIDARGPRFGALITTVVLAIILVNIPSTLATVLLTVQTVAFGLGAFAGLKSQPYGVIFRLVVAPRLSAPTTFEAPEPPRFAQLVGFIFAAVGLAALLASSTLVAQIAVGFALGAAFLNAAFAICLGCEMYVIGKRIFN